MGALRGPATGWSVVLASAAGFGLGLSGLPFYSMSVFARPLEATFGWSVADVQSGFTVMLLSNMATLPVASWVARRYGARPVACLSLLVFAVAFMSLGLLDKDLNRYRLTWALISVAGAGTLAPIWCQAISGWFTERRGLALGLAMTGTGITALVAPIGVSALIDGFGWRTAYVLLGGLPLVIALPLVLGFFRERMFWSETVIALPALGEVGQILRQWRFWLLGAAFMAIGAGVSGLIPNLVKVLTLRGFGHGQAALIAGAAGIFVLIGRVSCGALLDRFWASAVAAAYFLVAAAGCLALTVGGLTEAGAIAGAAAIGLTTGAEFDVMPYIAGRYFGVARLGLAHGLISVMFFLGAGAGPVAFGRLIDLTSGFVAPLTAGAALFVLGGVLLLPLGRYPAA